MARTPTGSSVADQARKLVLEAETADDLKRALCVLLPLEFGLSMEETGQALGITKGWACQIRRRFIQSEGRPPAPSQKIRNNAYLSEEEEAAFLQPFTEKAAEAGILIVNEIHQALEAKLGCRVSKATTYNLLHRNGWRKVMPDKRHPKADVKKQEEWKKNSRKS